jgi:hypothetical protein
MDFNDDYLFEDSAEIQQEDQFVEPDYTPGDDSFYQESDDSDAHYKEPVKQEPSQGDFISRMLRDRGVDRERVRIENDEGEIEEWRFDDLDDETKLGILSSNDMLSDDEIQTINHLRQNRMSLPDLINWQRQQAIQEYLQQNQSIAYTVDQVSDDDLYRFELQDQMPDLTEEEIEDQLARAKENESFFQKKIAALRKEYKELEDNQIKAEEERATAERENQFNQLAQSLVTVARNTEEMDGMIIEDEDKEEVLSFLLDRDANGQSEFYKLFSNPEALFKMAWYMKYGDQAHVSRTQYYNQEIAKARRGTKT